MKIYVIAVLLFAATVKAKSLINDDGDVRKNIEECLAEAKVTTELENIQMNNPMGLLNNPKLKCFSACMMKKKGTMKGGRIDSQQQLAEFPEAYEILKDIVSACSNSANQSEDECEVAHNYVKCIIKNISVY